MSGEKKTILIVDDEAPIRAWLGSMMVKDGHQVLYASNGKEALETVKTASPDLVLLDVSMPEMDGIEVCRQLRRRGKTRSLPIIVITGMDKTADETRGFEGGADYYLVKPFDEADLRARVAKLLRRAAPPSKPAPDQR